VRVTCRDTILLWGLPADPPLAAVRDALHQAGRQVTLLDQRAVLDTEVELLVGSSVEGLLRVKDQTLDLAAVKAVYLRPHGLRELPKIATPGQQSELWGHALALQDILLSWADLTPAMVLNRPSPMAANNSKPYQASWIESLGFRIPDTLITTEPDAVLEFWRKHERVIYKSVSGIRSIVSRLTTDHMQRFDHIASCPTQFQLYVPGKEYRVHVVGEEVFACTIISEADDYRYSTQPVDMQPCDLPSEVAALCRTLSKSMNLPLAGLDLRCTPDGAWYCFEVNPSPAFTCFQKGNRQTIAEAVARLLASGGDEPGLASFENHLRTPEHCCAEQIHVVEVPDAIKESTPMTPLETNEMPDRGTPATGESSPTGPGPQAPDTDAGTVGSGAPAPNTSTSGAVPGFPSPPAYFDEALEDAELLLKYAAEIGVDVNEDIRDAILSARAAGSAGWTEEIIADLLVALTHLAARLAPVTAQSLRACSDETRHTARIYGCVAICLAILIVPFSIVSFVTSAISTKLSADIDSANTLAVKLRGQLGPPSHQAVEAAATEIACANYLAKNAGAQPETGSHPVLPAALAPCPSDTEQSSSRAGIVSPSLPGASSEVPGNSTAAPDEMSQSQAPPGVSDVDLITELQQFASNVRSIDSRARQLNRFVFPRVADPNQQFRGKPSLVHRVFQLPIGMTNYSEAALRETYLFQDVRSFAQDLIDDVSFFYGAVSSCLLPALYALLGTCAYLLRSFEEQMRTRTFTPSHANFARFLIAAIGGAVVGLFNNFTITQSVSISPLAIAFLVGYAVDVFFAFLEGLLRSFTKSTSGASPPAASPSSGSAA
jgi:hypothetical protein